VAKDSELLEKPIVNSSHLEYQRRTNNIAIKSKQDVQTLVLLCKLSPSKLEEYQKYPLSSQLGFIHAIPEDDFDIASATITDVGFLGFFPKLIFLALRRCDIEIQRFSAVNITEFKSLVDNLIAAFFIDQLQYKKLYTYFWPSTNLC